MTALEGLLGLPGEARWGRLELEGGRIARVEPCERPAGARERLVVPGFVDLHVHGGGGADVMDGPEGVLAVAAFHLRHGTTALCPTTVTRPPEELFAALAGVAGLAAGPATAEHARLLGVHLEGPFIAPARRGAQPPYELPPDAALLERLLAAGPVATVTLAPELEGALELVRLCAARGVRASLGHSGCRLAEAEAAYAAGAAGTTHLFNAMSGLHHRSPGLAAAAFGAPATTFHELILDLDHVHPALVAIAARALPGGLCLVSDAIRATGTGDGESELGGQRVLVRAGRATLEDGTLAGSVLTLDRAFRTALRGPGLARDLAEAVRWSATNPADALGRADLGRLAAGAAADLVVLDDRLEVEAVWRDGAQVV
ncbi:MAG: N-acetylglucosamine-6-phosphate deacetylase [Planctomycetota bacterium]